MKQIIAVVKPYLAEKVLDALKLAPVEACGVCEVKGYGRQKNYLDEYRGSEYSMAYLPKVEITLVGRRSACRGSVADDRRGGPNRSHGRRKDFRVADDGRRSVAVTQTNSRQWTVGST